MTLERFIERMSLTKEEAIKKYRELRNEVVRDWDEGNIDYQTMAKQTTMIDKCLWELGAEL